MQQVILPAIIPAEKLVTIAKDNVVFSFWKSENGLIIHGVDFALENEAKRFSPIMYKIVQKYERLFGKRRRQFNMIEHDIVRNEFDDVYTKIKVGQITYDEYLLRGIY